MPAKELAQEASIMQDWGHDLFSLPFLFIISPHSHSSTYVFFRASFPEPLGFLHIYIASWMFASSVVFIKLLIQQST